MSSQPSVVVNKKGGVLTALVQGIFGFLIVSVLCVTVLGAYALWVADKKTDIALEWVQNISGDSGEAVQALAANLRNWREIAPPIIADAFNDRRDPAYREELELAVSVVPSLANQHEGSVLVEVTNHGEETVSLLTTRLEICDQHGVPAKQVITAVATPIAFQADDVQFQGPLMPGSSRRYLVTTEDCHRRLVVPLNASVSYEIAEVRLWEGPRTTAAPVDTVGEVAGVLETKAP